MVVAPIVAVLSCLNTFPLFFLGESVFAPPIRARQRGISQGRAGDGCYHVFVDCGSNLGMHGRFLFEPKTYKNSKVAVPLFNREFGLHRDNRDICVFAIEPNSRHAKRQRSLAHSYARMGWRYHYLPSAVSDNNSTLSFYHIDDVRFGNLQAGESSDLKAAEVGFGMAERSYHGAPTEFVPGLRLSDWLKSEILNRKIPEASHSDRTFVNKPKIVIKLDIEGSEYVVLPDLILSGAICYIDLIFGETHTRKMMPHQFEGHMPKINSTIDANKYMEALVTTIRSSRQCPVRFEWGDDESYVTDGIPLMDRVL